MTFAPIPKWHNISSAVLGSISSENLIMNNWVSDNEKGYWLSRSSWSLFLIIKFRILINTNNKVNVWLPDYFCNEATLQIRSLNINLSFYPVLSNGKPDLIICNEMLNIIQPDVILYVNYFGEPLFSKGLADISKKCKAWFVEDSTHCLKSEREIGCNGDFVIYSPHKLLSIPDGALLVVRNTGPNEIKKTLLQDFGFDSIYHSLIEDDKLFNLRPFKWLSKRLLQKIGLHLIYNRQIGNNEISSFEQLPQPKMSKLSKKLLSHMLDLEYESNHRKKIKKQWFKNLNDLKVVNKLNSNIDYNFTPYLARVALRDNMTRNETIDLFKNARIPISAWPDLPPEVLQNPDLHKEAIDMTLSYLFLPVHRSISEKNLKSFVRSF